MQTIKQAQGSGPRIACWPTIVGPATEASGGGLPSRLMTPTDTASRGPQAWPEAAAAMIDDLRLAMMSDPAAARAAASRLLAPPAVATVAAGEARGGLGPWQKRRIDQYMRAHLVQPLRLKQLAAQVSLSVSHFCRAFKVSFQATPHMYLIGLRIELAQRLMLTTQEPLSQIALACGMADQAHLSKLFRWTMHEAPAAWRRRNLAHPLGDRRSRASVAPARLM